MRNITNSEAYAIMFLVKRGLLKLEVTPSEANNAKQ